MDTNKWYVKKEGSDVLGSVPSEAQKGKKAIPSKRIITAENDLDNAKEGKMEEEHKEKTRVKEIVEKEQSNTKSTIPPSSSSSQPSPHPLVNEEWDSNWYRVFVGNLSPEVTDSTLSAGFNQYGSMTKAKVIREKNGKSKGFGFVAFKEGKDYLRAIKEMDGKFVGSKPINIKKSVYNKNKH